MLFEAHKIDYGYQWQNRMVEVLKGVDLEIPAKSFTCLVGPSGSGKTTLLNLLGLLDKPLNGSLRFDRHDVTTMSESQLEVFRLHNIGFVFQAFYLIPTLKVIENTGYFLSSLGLSKVEARSRSEEVLELVGLRDHMSKYPSELSGGQRQRVAIARAIAKKPKVVLADEPTANLDRKTAEDIIQAFKMLQESSGTSFVFATHDSRLVGHAKDIFELRDGKIVRDIR